MAVKEGIMWTVRIGKEKDWEGGREKNVGQQRGGTLISKTIPIKNTSAYATHHPTIVKPKKEMNAPIVMLLLTDRDSM